MQLSIARLPLCTAGLAVIVAAAVTGCAASSGSGSAGSSAEPSVTPQQAVLLAAKTTKSVESLSGTMTAQLNAKPGWEGSTTGRPTDMTMAGTFAEQLHPLLVSASIGSLTVQGTPMPGGLTEILSPTTLYLKWSIPLSSLGKGTGMSLDQAMNQTTGGSDPLAQTQMLGGATDVHQLISGTADGVPVTEYTGTLSLDRALSSLTGSAKTQMEQAISAAGFRTATFTAWIDANHRVRKATITEVGTQVTETVTITMTSINQPVDIAVPPASQTTSVPNLNSLG
jgi:hypothetical protein